MTDNRPTDAAKVYLMYNADRTTHAVVGNLGKATEIAVIEGLAFAQVTVADVESLEFVREPPDVPFVGTSTVVIRTNNGQVYKLGN
ncbi:hypothetical protein ACFL0Q_06430, partial [Thermodesulfobacteriota bacterium]